MVTTITRTISAATNIITAIVDVKAHRDTDGGLSILMSPALQARLQDIAAQVPQCPSSKRRHKRQSDNCGAKEFARRVVADSHLRRSLAQPLARGVWNEVGDVGDDGYVGPLGESSGYQDLSGLPGEDEGYESASEAWFEPGERLPELGVEAEAEVVEGSEVLETVVFAAEAEAEALALSAGEAFALGAGIAAGSGVALLPLLYSYLGMVWKVRYEEYHDLAVGAVLHIGLSNIHTISRTTTRTTQTTSATSSTSSAACSTAKVCLPMLKADDSS